MTVVAFDGRFNGHCGDFANQVNYVEEDALGALDLINTSVT